MRRPVTPLELTDGSPPSPTHAWRSDKVIGLFGPITAFASIGFQHSIANVGFYFVALAHGGMPFSFGEALWHNIVPSVLGNIVGAGFFVAGLLYAAYGAAKPEVFVIAQTKPHRSSAEAPGVVMNRFKATPRPQIGPGYLSPGGRTRIQGTPIHVEMPQMNADRAAASARAQAAEQAAATAEREAAEADGSKVEPASEGASGDAQV